ncbi:ACP S-malonyltransferase [Thermosulfurimonas marina]|uniref:ACP S-malonyltransferase n=1 Tax=Thermosulfurimonas marina TaxID=2047767 RepID=UPI001FE81E1D|nr:ACP S-malonyltransferase [Thermosulfurimonas marina]
MAVVFPGQGSQYVGMGRALFEARPEAREIFALGEEITGLPLRELAFSGPEEALQRTENLQPALTAVNLAVWAVLRAEGLRPVLVAGHSLGEFSALCAAGVLSPEDTFRLVRRRGELMARAGETAPGAMYAVIGLERSRLEDLLSRVPGRVYLANHNSPEQSVISGEEEAACRAAEAAKEAGAKRVVRLPVSGAFHSPLMEEAAREFQREIEAAAFRPAEIPVVLNVTAQAETDPEAIREALSRQMLSAVRWVEGVEVMVRAGVELFVEAGPKKVLSGLIRRIAPQVRVVQVEGPEEIENLLREL